ncbi:MAG: hypothetical protein IT323_03775 [Anaerolineae bacterium]|nr:hypothetical protein [Anaerolineae bacterium]
MIVKDTDGNASHGISAFVECLTHEPTLPVCVITSPLTRVGKAAKLSDGALYVLE